MLLAPVAALAAGCGGGDSDSLTEFEGSWRVTSDTARTSDFRLACPAIPFDDQFPLFTGLILDRGTVTDIFESAGPGNCQFGFNSVPKMKAIEVANPDPFTNAAPRCLMDLGTSTDPANQHVIDTQFVITPVSWVFNLQAPVSGKAPQGQLIGHATVSLNDVDVTAEPPAIVGMTACTFDVRENLDKVSKQ
ncbi:MAG: hypothetical protein ABUR63_06295 [Verrucomicrobiota bacterium]